MLFRLCECSVCATLLGAQRLVEGEQGHERAVQWGIPCPWCSIESKGCVWRVAVTRPASLAAPEGMRQRLIEAFHATLDGWLSWVGWPDQQLQGRPEAKLLHAIGDLLAVGPEVVASRAPPAVKGAPPGWTALQTMAFSGHLEGGDAVVRALLASGASVGERTAGGETALHLAAKRGSVGTVELLLEHGADPEQRNGDGRTPRQLVWQMRDRGESAAAGTAIAGLLEGAALLRRQAWRPKLHPQTPKPARRTVLAILLTAHRLSVTRGGALPRLPWELWLAVCRSCTVDCLCVASADMG